MKSLATFHEEMNTQTQKLKQALDIDYKEIKNMFADCQDQINEEDKWLIDLKVEISKEQKKILKCEQEMFDYDSGTLIPEQNYEETIKGNRLVGKKEFFGV